MTKSLKRKLTQVQLALQLKAYFQTLEAIAQTHDSGNAAEILAGLQPDPVREHIGRVVWVPALSILPFLLVPVRFRGLTPQLRNVWRGQRHG